MKFILSFLIFFVSVTLCAQSLAGNTFVCQTDDGVQSLVFSLNKRVILEQNNGTDFFGPSTYQFDGEQLSFSFDRNEGRCVVEAKLYNDQLKVRLTYQNKTQNLVFVKSTAQETSSLVETILPKENPKVMQDRRAQFPGGQQAFARYLSNTLVYPISARKANIEGKVYVQFVINKAGYVKTEDVNILKSLFEDCDQEAMRIIKTMPQWTPAIQDGKYVNMSFVIPINFTLN